MVKMKAFSAADPAIPDATDIISQISYSTNHFDFHQRTKCFHLFDMITAG